MQDVYVSEIVLCVIIYDSVTSFFYSNLYFYIQFYISTKTKYDIFIYYHHHLSIAINRPIIVYLTIC